MKKKEQVKTLDKILKFYQDKVLTDNHIWYLKNIPFLQNLEEKELVELQTILLTDSYVYTSAATVRSAPLGINSNGIQFISKGGYEAIWRKDRLDRFKSSIILSGIIFSILVGILTSTLSILSYRKSTKDQNHKIEKLEEQLNNNNLEIKKLKENFQTATIKDKTSPNN